MSTTIHSPRWRGRLVHTLLHVASQNKTDLHAEGGLTLMDLINRVFPEATKEQQEIIDQLIGRINDALSAEQAAQTVFATGEEEILFDLGKSDVKACLALNGHIARIGEETHFTQALAERERQKRKRERRHVFILVGIVAAVVLFVFIFNLPFFREMRLYSALESSPTPEEIYKYKRDFPEGKHIEEVYRIEAGLERFPMSTVKEYMQKYPQGKYAREFAHKHDSLWDAEAQAFLDTLKNRITPETEAYLKAMFRHMKENRVYTVYIDIQHEVKVKNLSEYPVHIQSQVHDAIRANQHTFSSGRVELVKQSFDKVDFHVLDNTLENSITGCFTHYIDSEFIQFTKNRETADPKSPVMKVSYVVQNRTVPGTKGFPAIFEYKETTSLYSSFLLGIFVSSEAQFTIPGSDVTLAFSGTGVPKNEFSMLKSVIDGYTEMTCSCIQEFASTITEKLRGKRTLKAQ